MPQHSGKEDMKAQVEMAIGTVACLLLQVRSIWTGELRSCHVCIAPLVPY